MNQQDRLQVVGLMQKDIEWMDKRRPGWSDTPSIQSADGTQLFSPKQVVQEVTDGTDFGKAYATTWMEYYVIRLAMGTEMLGDADQEKTAPDNGHLN